ncbi:MAG: LemA family protein [Bacteroidota bacterium]
MIQPVLIGICGLGTLVLFTAIVINNQIIAKKNRVAQAYGSIEIYLKKRFDLIPNLVAMLNKYMAHEKEVLLQATQLRARVQRANDPKEKIAASNELTQLMGGLNLNVENYPELKADKQFTTLQFELSDIEDQISAARRAYNAAVTQYNDKIQMFPATIVAAFRKDSTASLLEILKAEQKKINLNQLLNQ